MKKSDILFDSDCNELEQLPRKFTVLFDSEKVGSKFNTKVIVNGTQVGDVIDDNSNDNDSYRFHDVFHYTFAAMLGWSPCVRSMMKLKRKSNKIVDEIEDGARATITEESISLIVFNKAKRNGYFKGNKVSQTLLSQIKEMTSTFEVSVRSTHEWEKAILTGYSLFRELVKHNGGKIHFDVLKRTAVFES